MNRQTTEEDPISTGLKTFKVNGSICAILLKYILLQTTGLLNAMSLVEYNKLPYLPPKYTSTVRLLLTNDILW